MYQPTRASLRMHALPAWFDDAKLGIFVHWTPAAVPAWAPLTGPLHEVIARRGWRYWFAHNPYAEWYANTMRIAGSPTQQHHYQTYGRAFPYEAFVPTFKAAHAHWKPADWAAIFAEAGARYVVFVTKHHDGFLMWPSRHPNPRHPTYHAERDLVGELADAVRSIGLYFGVYYSSGLDWTFNNHLIQDLPDLIAAIPRQAEYATYVEAHWRELIARYHPSILWSDIAYPAGADVNRLFADYYNAVPEGVVNDRFAQFNLGAEGSLRERVVLSAVRLGARLSRLTGALSSPSSQTHADFLTPEYATPSRILAKKWETCRGMGYSFGYNQQENDSYLISPAALIHLLVDVVSKNGNLLLNVGPTAEGMIPEAQLGRLRVLGGWLKVNGEAIYGTRPWQRAEGLTADGTPVRFTCRGDVLYVIVMGAAQPGPLTIRQLSAAPNSTVSLLGGPSDLPWAQAGNDLAITLPPDLPSTAAHVLRITPPTEARR